MKHTILSACLLIWGPLAFGGWIQQNSGTTLNLYSVSFHHGSNLRAWACGDSGVIVATTNGGATWVRQNSGTMLPLYSITFSEESGRILAGGEQGILLYSTNDGSTWIQSASPTTTTIRSISHFRFYAVGDSGTILKSTDSGTSWSLRPSGTTLRLNAACGGFGDFVAGDSGLVLRTTNNGNSWFSLNTGRSENIYGIPLFGSLDLLAGDRGLILKSTNSGNTWIPANSGTLNKLSSVEYSTNNVSRIYAVGDNGTILKSTDAGVTWGFQASTTTANLHSTFFYLNDAQGYAVGDGGTILRTTDGGGAITSARNDATHPLAARLDQNYPNPFNPKTKIGFQVARNGWVMLRVFDLQGREVVTLVDDTLPTGAYETYLDGGVMASGVYLYQLQTESYIETKKLVLVK